MDYSMCTLNLPNAEKDASYQQQFPLDSANSFPNIPTYAVADEASFKLMCVQIHAILSNA